MALVSFGAVEAAVAQDPSDDRIAAQDRQIKALRDEIEILQRRLDAQIEELIKTREAVEAAVAEAAAARNATATIPARVKSEVDAAVKPRTDRIYYKGVAITPGGFLAAEYVHRSIDTGNDIATAFNGSYFRNNPFAHSAQTRFTARQSTLSLLLEADPRPQTHIRAFAEMDFQGAAQTATAAQSNSYSPRLMQFYGTLDWDDLHLHVLAGQAWSLLTLNGSGIDPRTEAIPATIDGQYMPGFTWARQAQIRLTQDIDQKFWLALSAENPQTTFYMGPNALPAGVTVDYRQHDSGPGVNSQNTLSSNHVPDIILKLAGDPGIGRWTAHVEVFGLHSSFHERLNGVGQSVSGDGFGVGLLAPLVPGWVDLRVSGLAGKGVGRYGSSQFPDVTFDSTGTLRPIREILAMGGLTVHATRRLDLYLLAGEEKASRQSDDLTTDPGPPPTIVPYGYGNPLYSNTGCASTTATDACIANPRVIEQGTAGFWYEPYGGDYGAVRLGVQFSHTEIKAFAGAGGVPVTIFNSVFASFRYYPFEADARR
jgi:hypothetical protein